MEEERVFIDNEVCLYVYSWLALEVRRLSRRLSEGMDCNVGG